MGSGGECMGRIQSGCTAPNGGKGLIILILIKLIKNIKSRMISFFSHRFSPIRISGLALVAGLLWLCGYVNAGTLYQCPRNLFTNQIDEAQARLQGCSLAAPGRLTQGLAPPAPPSPAAVLPTTSVAVAGSPVADPTAQASDAPAAPSVMPVTPATSAVAAAALVVQGMPVAPAAPVQTAAPRSAALARTHEPAAMRVASTRQRARDQDAQAILQTELARVVSAQRGAEHVALNRLREDEAALRREIARFNP